MKPTDQGNCPMVADNSSGLSQRLDDAASKPRKSGIFNRRCHVLAWMLIYFSKPQEVKKNSRKCVWFRNRSIASYHHCIQIIRDKGSARNEKCIVLLLASCEEQMQDQRTYKNWHSRKNSLLRKELYDWKSRVPSAFGYVADWWVC